MKIKHDPRHLSRIVALQKLFSNHFDTSNPETKTGNQVSKKDLDKIAKKSDISEFNHKIAIEIVNGVETNIEKIDQIITEYAPQWPIEQIQKVDLETLRIALYEGFITELTPPKVAIDEAIEISKEFGGDSSAKFVSGVLGAVYEKRKND